MMLARQQARLESIEEIRMSIINSHHSMDLLRAVISSSQQAYSLSEFQAGVSEATIDLAYKGEIDAVETLIKYANADEDDAVFGYTLGRHEYIVEGIARNGRQLNTNRVMQAHAQNRSTSEVSFLLSCGADPGFAILGYKDGGHYDLAKALEAKCADLSLNSAKSGLFAKGSVRVLVKEVVPDAINSSAKLT